MATSRANIPYSGYGSQGLQVFTPTRIVTITAGNSLDTTNVMAVRVSALTNYQINGAGTATNMPAGATGVDDSVTSFLFPNGATLEVMDSK